jgi:hypothetical protein
MNLEADLVPAWNEIVEKLQLAQNVTIITLILRNASLFLIQGGKNESDS